MIFVMVFVIIGILGIPYMWLVFSDDHHATAYGMSTAADTAPEAEPAPASAAADATPAGEVETPAPAAAAEVPVEAAPTAEAPTEPEAAAAPAEETPATEVTPAEKPAEPAPAAPEKEEPPPRVLPTDDEIAAWANGADVSSIGTLFEDLPLKKFDTFNTKFRGQEILPQHWQAISELEAPDDEVFDGLPEVGTLRQQYRDQELARRRLGAMKVAWRELRGRKPGLWQVSDLMAAIRRIIDKQIEVDFNDLLHGTRDLWRGMTLPVGQEQVEILWACIALVRKGTKK
jgi:hypothetical protein